MQCIFSDKEQLLEIAKANAAAMCAKAGMPIPASLRTSVLPFALPSMAMNAAMASMTAGTIWLFVFNLKTAPDEQLTNIYCEPTEISPDLQSPIKKLLIT